MTAAQKRRRPVVAEVDEELKPSPALIRELDDIEQANAQREATTRRPTTERAPRPFAYD